MKTQVFCGEPRLLICSAVRRRVLKRDAARDGFGVRFRSSRGTALEGDISPLIGTSGPDFKARLKGKRQLVFLTLYTIPELIPFLRLKPRAIRKLIASVALLGRLVGRQWLVTEEDLRAFLECEESVDETELHVFKERLAELKRDGEEQRIRIQEKPGNNPLSTQK